MVQIFRRKRAGHPVYVRIVQRARQADNVKTYRPPLMLGIMLNEVQRCSRNSLTFRRVNRFAGRHKTAVTTVSDFDDDQSAFVVHDQVELAIATPVVGDYESQASFFEESSCYSFGFAAGFEVFSHASLPRDSTGYAC